MKGGRNFTATAVIQKVKGGYTAWVEEMPNVISQGKTRKEAKENVMDALQLMLETNRVLAYKDARGHIERSAISISTSAV